ncbi:MAG: CocE/NonD family hydrolase, partial [Sandarakinorhabdus sp.]|nr:CocE/NonD family hydrolase [Sandarakinorhabdus sp.]
LGGANNPLVHLVIGPWRHSDVNYDGSALGKLEFDGDTGLQFRTGTKKPFLDQYLKTGGKRADTPAVLTYATGGGDAKAGGWERAKAWPMGKATPLYLQADKGLSFTAAAAAPTDTYVSDPAKPVPFVPRPIHLRDADVWKPWLVADQRFVADRPDVISFTTAPLDKAVHIAGQPLVDLFAATSGTDSDWVVKLIDVYPDDVTGKHKTAGMQLPVGIEIFRGRYACGFSTPAALTPGKTENLKFGLPNVNHVFAPGHRIMVQVQLSLFPLYDRNPQTFMPNIFNAVAGDYKLATQSIAHGPGQASAVWLPLVP